MPRLGLLVAGIVLAAGCGQTQTTDGQSLPAELQGLPTLAFHGDDFASFSTVEKLVAASDAVVAGTITEVSDGVFDPAPELEDFAGDQFLRVTLTVDTVLAGSDLRVGDMASIQWWGYQVGLAGNPARVYEANGVPYPMVGSEEVWFLRRTDQDGDWVVVDLDDGRYVRSGDTLRALASTSGEVARAVEQLGVAGLLELQD